MRSIPQMKPNPQTPHLYLDLSESMVGQLVHETVEQCGRTSCINTKLSLLSEIVAFLDVDKNTNLSAQAANTDDRQIQNPYLIIICISNWNKIPACKSLLLSFLSTSTHCTIDHAQVDHTHSPLFPGGVPPLLSGPSTGTCWCHLQSSRWALQRWPARSPHPGTSWWGRPSPP